MIIVYDDAFLSIEAPGTKILNIFSNFEGEIVPHVAANYKHLGELLYTRVEQL